MIGTTAAVLGGASLVGNLVSGFLGKGAAKKAGELQDKQAREEAANIERVTGVANQGINDAGVRAGEIATTAAKFGADQTQEMANNAATGVTTASRQANERLDPFYDAGSEATGTLRAGLTPGGEFNRNFSMTDLQGSLDPGYQFRLEEAQRNLNRTAAARGGALSGAALSDALRMSSGLASQETQNAFSRYNTTTQGRYDRLFGVSDQGYRAGVKQGDNTTSAARYGGDIITDASKFGAGLNTNAAQYSGTAGMNTAGTMGDNLIGSAKTAADLRTGGAAAKAAGVVGGTNALTKGITGGIGTATSALTLSDLLKNPATSAMPKGYKPPDVASMIPMR